MRDPLGRAILSCLLLLCLGCDRSEPAADQAAEYPTPRTIESLGISDLRQPEPGLATSGQITPTQMDGLHELGYALLVNLRPRGEDGTGWEEAHAKKIGMPFARVPVATLDHFNRANAELLAETLPELSAEHPVLVYCNSGNRVGALLALTRFWLDGVDRDAAMAYGRSAGMVELTPAIEQIMDR